MNGKKRTTTPNSVLQALQEGDHKAFEEIFYEYFNKIKLYIWRIIKSEEDAEEITQSIFVKLWENRQSLKIHTGLGNYMYVSARNSALNFIKSQYVRDSYSQDTKRVAENCTEDTDSMLHAEELRLIIEMRVKKMPERRQLIFNLSREQGLSHDEIAERLGISKKTVENQLSLAMKDIKEVILAAALLFLM